MFPHRNIHKYTWTSPDWNTHNQIDRILIDRRRHSIVLDVRSFRAADCDTGHYLVVANLGRDVECKEKHRVDVRNRFSGLEHLDTEVEISSTSEMIRENIKISAK
jgi:hypothetical protein